MSNQQSSTIYQENSDARRLFQDPNPQILRRPAQGPTQTYTQRVYVKFLQPPPSPPPGVYYIVEINKKKNCFNFVFSL